MVPWGPSGRINPPLMLLAKYFSLRALIVSWFESSSSGFPVLIVEYMYGEATTVRTFEY